MDSEGIHLAILFLISNAINGFCFGLFLFAFGVGSIVVAGSADGYIVCIVVGIVIIGVAHVGNCGAISQNKKQLNSYASIMTLLTAAEIVHLVVLSRGRPSSEDDLLRAYFVTMIFVIIVSIMSIMLACIMLYRIKLAATVLAVRH